MKNCQCFSDTLVACSCDKVGRPSLMMKLETNCYDYCITHSILGCVIQIAFCAAAIIMVWILLKYITEWIKLRRERKIEEASRLEKFKRESQSKLLEFIKSETDSFEKISKEYENFKKEVEIELYKLYPDKETDIILDGYKEKLKGCFDEKELEKIINGLKKDINSLIDKTKYEDFGKSLEKLITAIDNKDATIEDCLYYKKLNEYIGNNQSEPRTKTANN